MSTLLNGWCNACSSLLGVHFKNRGLQIFLLEVFTMILNKLQLIISLQIGFTYVSHLFLLLLEGK